MIRRLFTRRRDEGFVEARPGLLERLAELSARPPRRGVSGRILSAARWLTVIPRDLAGGLAEAVGGSLAAAFRAVRRGGDRRKLRHLLQGLPALAAAAGAAAVALAVAENESGLTRTYRELGRQALNAGRADDARLYLERLFLLDGGEAGTRFMLGLALDKVGRPEEAADLIRGVANGDGGGDPRANAWVATRLLADAQAPSDPKRRRELRRHLETAERGLPDDIGVKLGLVKLDLASGASRRAADRLAAAAVLEPALYYDLARLEAAAGRGEAAREAMERAVRFFRERLEAAPDDQRTRLRLADSVLALGHADQALAVLREGMTADERGPLAAAAARIHVAVYDRLAAGPDPDHAAMMGMLREALRYDPRSAEAAARLADFGGTGGAGPGGAAARVPPALEAEARAVLETLLAAGDHPPAVHMALGLAAWRRGEGADAEWHFEQAYDRDPTLVGVANNLAWALAHRADPDYDRALALIEQVLERFPDDPSYRDTRGEIYRGMGRWEEALRDLEFALPTLKKEARVHRSLAEVYDGLGKPRIAARHRDEAERLEGSAGRPATDAARVGPEANRR